MKKAFDNITQNKIWECLNRLEINSDLTERTKQTYERITSCLKTNRGRCEWFETKDKCPLDTKS